MTTTIPGLRRALALRVGALLHRRGLERDLHADIRGHRVHGEWFRRGPALEAVERYRAGAS